MTTNQRVARTIVSIGALAALHGCGGGSGTEPVIPPVVKPPTGLKIMLGAGTTDTIESQPAQALVVEVRKPDGTLAKGTVVRFEPKLSTDTSRRNESSMAVCSVIAPACQLQYYQFSTSDSTDAEGRARVLVRFGRVAGRGGIRVTVPDFGFEDSASYTVNPGQPAGISAGVPTLGLDIGGSTTLRGKVFDRAGNARPEVSTLSAGPGSAITVNAATNTISGADIGTQWAFVKFGTLTDSTNVRVVPSGRLVVWSPSAYAIRLVNINGSGTAKTIATNVSSDFGTFPKFDAPRTRITWHNGPNTFGGTPNVVVSLDTATGVRRELAAGTVFQLVYVTRQLEDGTLLVVGFRAGETPPATPSLWRVAADNSVTRVIALTDATGIYGGFDISPDGSRVAYLSQVNFGPLALRIVNVSTGTTNTVEPSARSPRFSPQGDRIAFLVQSNSPFSGSLDGIPTVANTDGTNRKVLGTGPWSPGVAWSPDGTYLIGRSSDFSTAAGLRVFRVRDGASTTLSLGEDYYQPDWR
jgi:WD40-like Beta Propeller Repeat